MLRATLLCVMLASVGECSELSDFGQLVHRVRRHDAKLVGLADESVSVIAEAIKNGATKESIVAALGGDYRTTASRGKRLTWTNGDGSLCVHLGRTRIARTTPLLGTPYDNVTITGYRVLRNHRVVSNSLSEQVAHAKTERELIEALGEPSERLEWESALRWKRPDGEINVIFRDGLAVGSYYTMDGEGFSRSGGWGMLPPSLDPFPPFRLERTK